MKLIYVISIILILLNLCHGDTLHNVQELYDTFFTKANYNRYLRGVKDQKKYVRVATNFSLIGIGNIMEVEEAFEVMGILDMSWIDERLVWNPNTYNGTTELLLYQDMIWKPEVKLSNPMLDVFSLGNDRTYTRVYHTGKVTWTTPHLFRATCKINVISFPWDRQSCALKFMVSGYSREEVTVDIDQPDVDTQQFEEHGSWSLVKTAAVPTTYYNAKIEYWFCFERRSSFHISVVFFPVVILSTLSLFTFILKIDSGERISYTVTLLLSITVDLTMMSDLLPTHSKGMASIIIYLNAVLAESALICIISILNLYLYHKEGNPPYVFRKIFNFLFCKRLVRVVELNVEHTEDKTEIVVNQKDDAAHDDLPELKVTWADLSRLVDGLCMSIASLSLVVFYIVFGVNVTLNIVTCDY